MRRVTGLRARSTADEGFTLVELVVAVAILGIISTALIGIAFQYLKVTTSNRTRLSESTDQQFISAYWQQDVSSLGSRTFAPTNDPNADQVPSSPSVFQGGSGCGDSLGPIVVRFTWRDFEVGAANPDDAWTFTEQQVSYVRVAEGAVNLLKRVRCEGATEGAPITVAHNVLGAPTVICAPVPDCTIAALPERVSMEFTVRDEPGSTTSYTTTVTADRRQG